MKPKSLRSTYEVELEKYVLDTVNIFSTQWYK
jgi:hypothetical protein